MLLNPGLRGSCTIIIASQDTLATNCTNRPYPPLKPVRMFQPFIIFTYTVEPLSNDHPHQRPSLLYDHILCDGQCFLFVRSLTNDHPSDATNDRVRWDFLPRKRPPRLQCIFKNRGWRFNIRSQRCIITVLCLLSRHLSSNSIDLNFLLFWRRRYKDVLRSTLHRYDVANPPALRHICSRPNSSALN